MELNIQEATGDLGTYGTMLWAWSVEFLPRAGGALLILVLGFLIAGWAGRAIARVLRAAHRINKTVVPVLAAAIRYSVLIVVIVAALGQLGVQTTSLLAVLGAAGLALGLALQGTLSNIAAGIMLLWLRPFDVGDAIEFSGAAGTVEEIDLFNTRLRTWDGVYKFVPNSQLWNTTLTNYSRNPTRLVVLNFNITYDSDIAAAREALRKAATEHPNVLKDPAPTVVPQALTDTAVVLQLRAWAPNPVFGDTQSDLTELGKKRLEEAGITIPSPQRLVQVLASEKNDEAVGRSDR